MHSDNLVEYLKESSKNTGIYYLNKDIPVWMEDPLPPTIQLDKVLSKVQKVIPTEFFRYVHAIRIGMFDEMVDRQLNAMYKDGVIFISNMQDDGQDIVDDLIHEMAHAIEDNNYDAIYSDGKIEQEFIGKRKRLYNLLKSEGFDVTIKEFMNPKYDEGFDMFLFQDVGYPLLNTLTVGLFPSAYSVTSVNEYFAIGFENFYLGEAPYLKRISPRLSEKIKYLDETINEY